MPTAFESEFGIEFFKNSAALCSDDRILTGNKTKMQQSEIHKWNIERKFLDTPQLLRSDFWSKKNMEFSKIPEKFQNHLVVLVGIIEGF